MDKKPFEPNDGWAKTHTDRAIYHDCRHRAYLMRQHPIGRFIVDFYCAKARLVIEVDGSVHKQPGYEEYDKERQAYLESLGLHVLRFSNDEVMQSTGAALRKIRAALRL